MCISHSSHMPEPSALHHNVALRHIVGATPQQVCLPLYLIFSASHGGGKGVGNSGGGAELLRLGPAY